MCTCTHQLYVYLRMCCCGVLSEVAHMTHSHLPVSILVVPIPIALTTPQRTPGTILLETTPLVSLVGAWGGIWDACEDIVWTTVTINE